MHMQRLPAHAADRLLGALIQRQALHGRAPLLELFESCATHVDLSGSPNVGLEHTAHLSGFRWTIMSL